MLRIRPIEVFLIQLVLYLGLWLWDEYAAILVSVSMAGVFLAILLISLIVEKIEPSKVPRWYFLLMLASVLAPVLVGVGYMSIMGWDLLSIFEF